MLKFIKIIPLQSWASSELKERSSVRTSDLPLFFLPSDELWLWACELATLPGFGVTSNRYHRVVSMRHSHTPHPHKDTGNESLDEDERRPGARPQDENLSIKNCNSCTNQFYNSIIFSWDSVRNPLTFHLSFGFPFTKLKDGQNRTARGRAA